MTVVTRTPASAIGPPPKRSVSLPASGIASAMPRPCGAVSRPVSITLSWRSCCQYSGIRIIAPNTAAPSANIVIEAAVKFQRR